MTQTGLDPIQQHGYTFDKSALVARPCNKTDKCTQLAILVNPGQACPVCREVLESPIYIEDFPCPNPRCNSRHSFEMTARIAAIGVTPGCTNPDCGYTTWIELHPDFYKEVQLVVMGQKVEISNNPEQTRKDRAFFALLVTLQAGTTGQIEGMSQLEVESFLSEGPMDNASRLALFKRMFRSAWAHPYELLFGNQTNTGDEEHTDTGAIQKQIKNQTRRLNRLRESLALKGFNADASLSLEIEDIEKEIAKLKAQLQ